MRSVLTRSDIERMRNQRRNLEQEPDDLLTQVSKSIPAEVLAFYLFSVGVISLVTEGNAVVIANVSWIIFIAGFLGTRVFNI